MAVRAVSSFALRHWRANGSAYQSVLLSLLFILSFAIPLLFASNLFERHSSQDIVSMPAGEIPVVARVSANGQGLVIRHAGHLIPPIKDDFLLVSWFKLADFPSSDALQPLISKIDLRDLDKPGFSLSLKRDGNLLRPSIYWKSQKAGQSYDFAPSDIVPGRWFMLSVSFLQGRYLGLHVGHVEVGEKPIIKLLGGYDFLKFPRNTRPWVFGSGGAGFRGEMGPVLVVSGKRIGKNLPALLSESASRPGELPRSLGASYLKLLVRGAEGDLSKYKQSLKLTSADSKS